ncbi:MAG TPA: hypothetical protein VEH30_07905 [Terriglobales bacterium]|nr:hypothetical protein [Terriglobales bacterium]
MKLGKWLGLAVAAVILAEGVWGILVSLTRSLLLPLLARALGGDPHSPLYLGPGDINVPDLFGSILQLCLAGIIFLAIKSWAAKEETVRSLRVKKVAERAVAPVALNPAPYAPIPVAAQPAKVPAAPAPTNATEQVAAPTPIGVAAPVAVPAAPIQAKPNVSGPDRPAKPPKPAKPEKPREVYYNIVGEPINPTEDDD